MKYKEKIKGFIEKIKYNIEIFREKIRIKKTFKYKILTGIIVLGYVFFFISGYIFTDNSGIKITELNQKIVLKNSRVLIREEKFSKENNVLQVKIDLEKTNVNFLLSYKFKAISKEDTNKELPIEVINLDDGNIVLLVSTPKSWSAIAIDIEEQKISEPGETRIYIDKEQCIMEENLEKKSKEIYLIENLESDIASIRESIKTYELEIDQNNITIKNTEIEILEIEKQKEFLVGEELQTANSNIEKYKNDIKSIQTTIINNEDKILNAKEKISVLNKKIIKIEDSIL